LILITISSSDIFPLLFFLGKFDKQSNSGMVHTIREDVRETNILEIKLMIFEVIELSKVGNEIAEIRADKSEEVEEFEVDILLLL
jgi:hypothetical protein